MKQSPSQQVSELRGLLPSLIPLAPYLFVFMNSENIFMRGSRSAAFISPASSKTTEDLDSKSRAIEDINFPAVTPCTRALNSLNIYKAPLGVHPFLQTSLRSSDRASTAHPCSRSSAQVLRPRYLHTHSTSSNRLCSNRSHFSPKYRSLQARCLCQFWGCWQDGWICACPVCAVRTVSDLCQLQLKSPKKKKKKELIPFIHSPDHLSLVGGVAGRNTFRTDSRGLKTHPKHRRSRSTTQHFPQAQPRSPEPAHTEGNDLPSNSDLGLKARGQL